MLDCIARLFEPLLQRLLPATGRHRSPVTGPASRPAPARATSAPASYRDALRGEDNRLVRPYLLAHEQREEARQQRARRRALWFAVHGIDNGPRLIHGMEVTA